MVNILDLASRSRNVDVEDTSAVTPMEPTEFLSPRDIVLTAAVVMPASFLWIVTERMWTALALGALVYLGTVYGYPWLRSREFDLQPLMRATVRFYQQARALARFRDARRA